MLLSNCQCNIYQIHMHNAARLSSQLSIIRNPHQSGVYLPYHNHKCTYPSNIMLSLKLIHAHNIIFTCAVFESKRMYILQFKLSIILCIISLQSPKISCSDFRNFFCIRVHYRPEYCHKVYCYDSIVGTGPHAPKRYIF